MKKNEINKYDDDMVRHLLHVYLFSLKCATITKGALDLKECILYSIHNDRDITREEYLALKQKMAKRDLISAASVDAIITQCLTTSQNKLSVLTNMEILEMYGLPVNYSLDVVNFINVTSRYIRKQMSKTNEVIELA